MEENTTHLKAWILTLEDPQNHRRREMTSPENPKYDKISYDLELLHTKSMYFFKNISKKVVLCVILRNRTQSLYKNPGKVTWISKNTTVLASKMSIKVRMCYIISTKTMIKRLSKLSIFHLAGGITVVSQYLYIRISGSFYSFSTTSSFGTQSKPLIIFWEEDRIFVVLPVL